MIHVSEVGPGKAKLVLDLVQGLLKELGEEGDEAGILDRDGLTRAWEVDPSIRVFVAWAGEEAVGVATVSEAFAIYANGPYGIINEMYVTPEHRSAGVGHRLVEAVRELGQDRGWRRLDVTAPESGRWQRTRRFYEREGFVFTGPKLKLLL